VSTSNTENAYHRTVAHDTDRFASTAELDTSSDQNASPDVSVVVPTHNRQLLVARTLESLMCQRTGSVRYEVLVIDNNSSDGTRAVVESFARRWPPVRYFFEPRPGVSNARNTGIAAARAPIVAFIDDDVEADPAWVATIKRTLDDHPDIDCVGGRIEPRWAAPPPTWFSWRHWGAVALQGVKGDTPYVDADHASPCLMTANFASRRAALNEVGGFSPEFFRDEDRELQLRLWSAGKRGLYVHAIGVTTEVPPERLTKRYHRRHHWRVGASHARMRYPERLDREGRLLPPATRHPAMLFGVPGFIFRDLFRHAAAWAGNLAILDYDRAFFHETRTVYFCGYVRDRWRQQGPALWSLPWHALRFGMTVLFKRLRARARALRA
jgi:glycosyltransferase involved in cell wall biosynthesis